MGGDALKKHLSNEVHRVDWKPLAPHAKRGALVMVDSQLDLVEVAIAVAQDDTARVAGWLDACKLLRPTEHQLESWEVDTNQRFTIIIVQPYVLAQRDTGSPVT